MSEALYVPEGLRHHAHQTDLRILEHHTDTAGATDCRAALPKLTHDSRGLGLSSLRRECQY